MSSQSIRKTKNANKNHIIAMTKIIHQLRNTNLQLRPVINVANVPDMLLLLSGLTHTTLNITLDIGWILLV